MSTNESERGNPVFNFFLALVSALVFASVLIVWDFGVIPGNSTVFLKEGEQAQFNLSCGRIVSWTVKVDKVESGSSVALETSIPTYASQTVSRTVTLAEKDWLELENCVGREERVALLHDVVPEQKMLVLKVNAFGLAAPASLGEDVRTENKLVTLASYFQFQLESFQRGTTQEKSVLALGAACLLMIYAFPFLYGIGVWRKTDARFQRELQSGRLEQYHEDDEFWTAYFKHLVIIVVTMLIFVLAGATLIAPLKEWLTYFGWFRQEQAMDYVFLVFMYAVQASFGYTFAFWLTSQVAAVNSKFRQEFREWRDAF